MIRVVNALPFSRRFWCASLSSCALELCTCAARQCDLYEACPNEREHAPFAAMLLDSFCCH